MSSFCKRCSRMLRGPRIVVGDFCGWKCRVLEWLGLCLLVVLALAGCAKDRDVRRLNLFENSIEKPNNPEAPTQRRLRNSPAA